MITDVFVAWKKTNAAGFEAGVLAAGEIVVGEIVAALLAGTPPARAEPLLEANCCKKALGNDSILVEPGAWIIGSRARFVNQTPHPTRDSFAACAIAMDKDLIQHTIGATLPKKLPARYRPSRQRRSAPWSPGMTGHKKQLAARL